MLIFAESEIIKKPAIIARNGGFSGVRETI